MPKLSNKQQRELRILKWWKPANVKWGRITNRQIRIFFDWSDKGVAHGRNVMNSRDGFCALYWAKNRRDLQITMYLRDWGETVNAWSFKRMGKEVKEDISKRMRKELF